MGRQGEMTLSPTLRRRRQRSLENEDGNELGNNWRASLLAAKEERIARFKQQTMTSITMTFSPRAVILIYFGIALIFIPIGAAIFTGSYEVRDTGGDVEYSNRCGLKSDCIIEFKIKRTIKAPSYMYYVIGNMMQNYLTYARSRSYLQLRGETPQFMIDVRDCCPRLFIEDHKYANALCLEKDQFNPEKNPYNLTQIRNPCGLAAWTKFNDSYTLCRDNTCTKRVKVSNDGISWSTDVNKYRPGQEPHFTSIVNTLLQDEHFRVWMRLSGFSRIEKLWGRVEEELEAGTYYMRIDSHYDVTKFDGVKYFNITELKWFGAKNVFLGILYIVTGVISLSIGLVMLAAHVWCPRKRVEFDPELLKSELEKLNKEKEQSNQPLTQNRSFGIGARQLSNS